jgi:hypothetical protein
MQPTNIEILRACVVNLEEVVTPNLEDPHARSAALCIRTLLNHVALRLEKEAHNLQADSREKRELIAGLIPRLRTVAGGAADALKDLAARLEQGVRSTKENPAYITPEALTEENDALRRLVVDCLKTLQARRGDIEAETFAELKRTIRKQLRAESMRDNTTVLIDGPLF